FALRRELPGKHAFRDAIGRWGVDPLRNALVLRGGAEMPLQFEILGPDRLRPLDMQGKPIEPSLPYELISDGRFAPTDLSLPLGGEMRYMADAALFTECLTGRRYPMAMEGDYLKAERAYLGAVTEPGAPLYATLEGEIVQRPRMEGEGTQATVVVRRFINVWPRQKCERARVDASLVNTWWRIVRLGDEPVQAAPDRREPHLVLKAGEESGWFSATVGCNQMAGGYSVDGEAIRITPSATTMMACPAPLAETENKLGQLLERAKRWRINASTLELFDEAGAPVALFEAVYL
ncbi:MAG TPA: META domain-containing protein, partial [Burkholderiales bacterium]